MLKGLLNSLLGRAAPARGPVAGPLAVFLNQPPPPPDTPFERAEFLAIDLETSGLDAEKDEILSVGYVPIVGGAIRLGQAGYFLVKPGKPVPEKTAVIHGLLDGHLENAPSLDAVLPQLLLALTGRTPVAHHARIERTFLDAACTRLYGGTLGVKYADTLALEKRSMTRRGQEISQGDLRLSAVRERYGLPRYKAHNALTDALAAAELFLAQASHASGRGGARVADFIV